MRPHCTRMYCWFLCSFMVKVVNCCGDGLQDAVRPEPHKIVAVFDSCTPTLHATGTHNQNIQVYDLSTLNHECTLSGHIGIVTVLRVTESPYGVYMFSGSSDATVQVNRISQSLCATVSCTSYSSQNLFQYYMYIWIKIDTN